MMRLVPLAVALAGTLIFAVPTGSLSLRTRAALDAAGMLAARSPGPRALGAVSDKHPLVPNTSAAVAAPAVALPIESLAVTDPIDLAVFDVPEPATGIGATPIGGIRYLPLFHGGPALRAGSAVPEPATWSAMLTGFGMIGLLLRKRRRATLPAEADPAA